MEEETTFTFDYGKGKYKDLVLTSDKKVYEDLKAQKGVEVLFEPLVVDKNLGIEVPTIYLLGTVLEK